MEKFSQVYFPKEWKNGKEGEPNQQAAPSTASPPVKENPASAPENVAENVERFGEAREELRER